MVARKREKRTVLMREGTGEQSGSETFLHPDPAVDAALDWLVRLEAAGHVDKTTRSEFDV